ncbi:MAG: hypothetical protein H6654_07325 [Ardenticatenaceae bacterium]|nr:hypothetical protein [Anaerolineales bacterium]MCB8940336.1 hypothetical protein [Ardenticatenaceae bacterium]MCB8973352.1 hypothetical protein [Ardenticatenaceae bacterium]
MASENQQNEPANTFTIKTITDALKNLKTKAFHNLGNHPLSRLRLVSSRHQTTTNKRDEASLGLTLHTILLEAVNSLKSTAGNNEQPSIYYTILRERFINGLGTEYVAQLLNLSRRQYFREQNQAITQLGAILREWEYAAQRESAEAEPATPFSWSALKQAAAEMSRPFWASVQGKYDPRVYHQRRGVYGRFQTFLKSEKTVLVITGNSGAGKSCFLAALPAALANDEDVLFIMLNGVGLSVEHELTGTLAKTLAYFLDEAAASSANLFANIDDLIGQSGRKVVVVFDAINEHAEGSKLLYRIDQMASAQPYPWLKLVISSRSEAWRVLKRPLTLSHSRYYQEKPAATTAWYQPTKLGVRLTRFQQQDMASVYESYRQTYALQTAYSDLKLSLRNALRDPLLLRLIAETYTEAPMPQHIHIIDIFPAFVRALVASQRLREEDILFLEQELVPLMLSDGAYSNKLSDAQTRDVLTSSGEPLWKFIVAHQPTGWGQHSNDSFTRLVDAGILKHVDETISFRYERFYDYFGGRELYAQLPTDTAARAAMYQALAEEAYTKPFLSGPVIHALGMELAAENIPLIMHLAELKSHQIRDKLVAALTEYGLGNREKTRALLSQLWQAGQSLKGNLARAGEWLWDTFYHDAVSATCSASDYIVITVAARLQFQDLLETMLADWSPAVRAVAIRQSFILWRRDREVGFALLSNLADRLLHGWQLPRPHILESLIGLSLMFLFDAYTEPEWAKRLRTLWRGLLERLLFIQPGKLGKRPYTIKNLLRTAVLKTIIGFAAKTTRETPDDSVLDLPELRLFFKNDAGRSQRRDTARQLCAFMDVAETAVTDLHQLSLELVNERDLLIAILAQTAWRRHVLATPDKAIPLVVSLFNKAIEVEPAGPFSHVVPTFAIPLDDRFATIAGRTALSHIYATINRRTQGCWQNKQRSQRWPGLTFFCMAQSGQTTDVPLCPEVTKIVEQMIALRDINYINWVIKEELRNALVEFGYYQFGFAILKMIVQEADLVKEPAIRIAIVDLLSRVHVYEPELVENFLEVNQLVNDMGHAIRTTIPTETIGDLVNYRAAMFWFEVLVNNNRSQTFQSLTSVFNQLDTCNRLETWVTIFFQFIVNEIYGEPIFAVR